MPIPTDPKIYHIVHVDRLPYIIAEGQLLCDAQMQGREGMGTTIGMSIIKERRLHKALNSQPELHVGDCVPFYFCPRSIMLYIFYMNNHPDVTYRGGQEPIIHLESDLNTVIDWAEENDKRWVITTSNAGSNYFEDYCTIDGLEHIDWMAVNTRNWQSCQESKQAEFLLEDIFPWNLVNRIGVFSPTVKSQVESALLQSNHTPMVSIKRNWYY